VLVPAAVLSTHNGTGLVLLLCLSALNCSSGGAAECNPGRKPRVKRDSSVIPTGLNYSSLQRLLVEAAYRRNRPKKYSTTDNTTLTTIEVASGK
jgi:hypothetical protein